MGRLERAGLLAAFTLTVAGVAFIYWPAGLIVAGILTGYAAWPDATTSGDA